MRSWRGVGGLAPAGDFSRVTAGAPRPVAGGAGGGGGGALTRGLPAGGAPGLARGPAGRVAGSAWRRLANDFTDGFPAVLPTDLPVATPATAEACFDASGLEAGSRGSITLSGRAPALDNEGTGARHPVYRRPEPLLERQRPTARTSRRWRRPHVPQWVRRQERRCRSGT